MELDHEFTVPVPVDRAWPVLLDLERVAPCVPGATLDSVDGDEFTGRLKVKLGAMTITYRGAAGLVVIDESAHIVTIEGSAKEARGTGTAAATVQAQLHGEGDDTRVTVHTKLNITGRPAQFGRGILAEVGAKLISRFAKALAEELQAPDEEQQAPAAEPQAQAAEPAAESQAQAEGPQTPAVASQAAEPQAAEPQAAEPQAPQALEPQALEPQAPQALEPQAVEPQAPQALEPQAVEPQAPQALEPQALEPQAETEQPLPVADLGQPTEEPPARTILDEQPPGPEIPAETTDQRPDLPKAPQTVPDGFSVPERPVLSPDEGTGESADESADESAGEAAEPVPSPVEKVPVAPRPVRHSEEAIDLLEVAGPSVVKRAAPVFGGIVALLTIRYLFRRRRGRHHR